VVTYIDARVARDRARLECYRSILADGRFFVTDRAEGNDMQRPFEDL
jgi:hypothetical protein